MKVYIGALLLNLMLISNAFAEDSFLEKSVELFPHTEMETPLNKSLQTSAERGSEMPKLVLEGDPSLLSSLDNTKTAPQVAQSSP